jgi:hypothetical protein
MVSKKVVKKTVTKSVKKETPAVNMSRLESFTFFDSTGKSTKGSWLEVPWNDGLVVRILPPCFGQDFWITEHTFHGCNVGGRRGGWSFQGEQGEYRAMITCLDAYEKGPCPICEVIDWAAEDGDEGIQDGIKIQKKYIMNVLVRDTNEVKLWGASPGAAKGIKKIVDSLKKKSESLSDIAHPVTGRDIIILKAGDPKNPMSARYTITACDKEPLDFDGWESKAFDLGNSIRFLDRPTIIQAIHSNIGGLVPVKDIFGNEMKTTKESTKKPGKNK